MKRLDDIFKSMAAECVESAQTAVTTDASALLAVVEVFGHAAAQFEGYYVVGAPRWRRAFRRRGPDPHGGPYGMTVRR